MLWTFLEKLRIFCIEQILFYVPSHLLTLLFSQCWLIHFAFHCMVDSYGICVLQIVFNKVLRWIWNLPGHSHTKIVHCVSHIESTCIKNLIHKRFSGCTKKLCQHLVLFSPFFLTPPIQCILLLVTTWIVTWQTIGKMSSILLSGFDMYGTVLASIHFWRIIYNIFHLFSLYWLVIRHTWFEWGIR